MSFGFGLGFPRARSASLEAAIAGLFPDGWYDPSDLTTLFQDAAGTTPVTALEQPVGLMLDKSGNNRHAYHTPGDTTTRPTVSRRINLLTKTEDFADAAWTVKKNPVYGVTDANGGANAVRVTSDASSQIVLRQPNYTIVSGVSYTHRLAIRRVTGTGTIHVTSTSNAPTDVTSQVSSAWAYVTVTGVNPQASGANGYFLITLGTSGDSIEVCFPSAVPADLSGLPYQRVNTTTDYDTSSVFPTFLRTDGVNDSLQTNAIDFTATDKMFVGVGVRKQSDAAGVLVGLGSDTNVAGGRFEVLSSGWTTTASRYGAAFNISTLSRADSQPNFSPPRTDVIDWAFDVAGATTADEFKLRVNAANQTLTATDAPQSGNFGNHKLYLFMRGGSGLPFNGWFYGGIIKGATLTASQIALAERWLASKTKTVVLA